ncbi:cytochrome c biogenesis protein CcdA [Xanthobacter sp. DSM 24535]|uniref:cytochrome c biogenesis CcdA family protein n=1 Tax=Roseixanthobacter psychrophilus TaxID=3119917 RepID=UPI00372C3346
MSLDISLPGAFLAGLLSFASPCVLPLVPAYLGFLTGAAAETAPAGSTTPEAARPGTAHQGAARLGRGRVIVIAGAFVLGFSTIFILLGATASGIGQWLTRYADILGVVSGAVLILFGLHLLGLVKFSWLYRQAKLEVSQKPAGLLGAYLVGLAFGFGWSPCVGPVLAAILIVAGAESSLWRGALLLAFYAAGIGIPFLAAAAFAGPFLIWARAVKTRLGLIEKVSGALLVATGLVFMTGLMPEVSQLLLDAVPALGTIG